MRTVYFLFLVLLFSTCASTGEMSTTNLVEVGSIYGFITNEAYEPLSNAKVMVASEPENFVFTNAAGYYNLMDLEPGPYTLVITRIGYLPQNMPISIFGAKKQELNVLLKQDAKGRGSISGMVVDYITTVPLAVDVTIEGELNMAAHSDSAGYFEFKDLEPKKYLLRFRTFDYTSSIAEVEVLPGQNAEVMMRMFKINSTISLYGIEFEFGKANILPVSAPVLDTAAALLTNNPEVEVEVQGHTDDVGSDEYNRELSQKRAEAVRQYLIDVHMIEPVRLIAIGYGESKPVAENTTEQGRAKNRRVDFLILK